MFCYIILVKLGQINLAKVTELVIFFLDILSCSRQFSYISTQKLGSENDVECFSICSKK